MIAGWLVWNNFWLAMGVAGIAIAAALFILLAKSEPAKHESNWFTDATSFIAVVFKPPQSLRCGLIAGLFIPTIIFDMIRGVRFLEEAHGFDYSNAVMRSAKVPLGWIIGCPLPGIISDRLRRRWPVLIDVSCMLLACLAWVPPNVIGILTGLASGAAMLTYSAIKEANPPHLAVTATGVIGFLHFLFSALLGLVFGWIMKQVSSGHDLGLSDYQRTFRPLLYGVTLAVLLAYFGLRETGPALRSRAAAAEAA